MPRKNMDLLLRGTTHPPEVVQEVAAVILADMAVNVYAGKMMDEIAIRKDVESVKNLMVTTMDDTEIIMVNASRSSAHSAKNLSISGKP